MVQFRLRILEIVTWYINLKSRLPKSERASHAWSLSIKVSSRTQSLETKSNIIMSSVYDLIFLNTRQAIICQTFLHPKITLWTVTFGQPPYLVLILPERHNCESMKRSNFYFTSITYDSSFGRENKRDNNLNKL